MRRISPALIEQMRKEYPVGTRVVLEHMDDEFAPPAGTMGTVQFIDDLATLHVAWDTGSGLGVAYGVDSVRKAGVGNDG